MSTLQERISEIQERTRREMRTLPLDQVAEAQRQVATGHVRGKILLDLTQ